MLASEGRLQNFIIHESDGFKKTVLLSHKGLLITAEIDEGLVHIDHSNNRFRIYVPQVSRQRQRCHSTQLPKALVTFLEVEYRAATEVFRLLCLLQEDVIENVLDDNGIRRISYADIDDPDPDFSTEPTEESSLDGNTLDVHGISSDGESRSSETGFPQGSMASLGTPSRSRCASSADQRPEYEPKSSMSAHQQTASSPGVSVLPHFAQPSSDTTVASTSYNPQYVRLLDHVIMLARRAASPHNSDDTSTTTSFNGSSTQGLAPKNKPSFRKLIST